MVPVQLQRETLHFRLWNWQEQAFYNMFGVLGAFCGFGFLLGFFFLRGAVCVWLFFGFCFTPTVITA